jgi:hypothetical protein
MWKDLWPDLLYMRFVTNAVVTEDVDLRSFPELTGICLIE